MLCVRFFVGFVRSDSRWEHWLLGVVPLFELTLKISYERLAGQTLFVSDLGEGIVLLASAHFAGLVLGLLWGCLASSGMNIDLGPGARRRIFSL